jgi:hypothetical protein
VLALMASRALLSFALVKHGFRALSDDDYSRVVIAQTFAEHPSLDPSKTSWLPFPFWLYGTLMAGFGKSLATARAVAFIVGLLSAAGVWLAGRWLGLARGACLLGGLIACFIPYSAWLGVATTPDVYSATLALLACCSLSRHNVAIRTLGALAIVLASLSRYEAWPVAAICAVFACVDAARIKRWRYVLLALIVLAPPAIWMLHGFHLHQDALFFVKRVTNYRRALGLSSSQGLARLMTTPGRLISDVPELCALALVAGVAATRLKVQRWRKRWVRPSLGILSVIAFLCIGDWRDGAATHHAGRTLLTAWYFAAVIIAGYLWSTAKAASWRGRTLLTISCAAVCFLTTSVIRPLMTSTDGSCPRNQEVTIGLLAGSHVATGERLAIDTPDYGYFAVQAAFARPGDVVVVDNHDPRNPRAHDIFRSSDEVCQGLANMHAHWIVTTLEHEENLSGFASIHYRGSTLLLAQIR